MKLPRAGGQEEAGAAEVAAPAEPVSPGGAGGVAGAEHGTQAGREAGGPGPKPPLALKGPRAWGEAGVGLGLKPLSVDGGLEPKVACGGLEAWGQGVGSQRARRAGKPSSSSCTTPRRSSSGTPNWDP